MIDRLFVDEEGSHALSKHDLSVQRENEIALQLYTYQKTKEVQEASKKRVSDILQALFSQNRSLSKVQSTFCVVEEAEGLKKSVR